MSLLEKYDFVHVSSKSILSLEKVLKNYADIEKLQELESLESRTLQPPFISGLITNHYFF